MKEKIKDKKVIAGLVIVIVAIISAIAVFGFDNSVIHVKDDTVMVEYGKSISTDINDYIDKEKVDKKDIAKMKVKVDVANEKDKEYPSIGEYKIELNYEKEVKVVKVIVQDTTAPIFKDFKEAIETPKDVKIDYEALYVVEDLSKSKVACEDGSVKYDTIGDYKATIKAIDQYQNEVKKEITVKIIEPTIKLDKESVSLYVKETAILKTTIVGKEQKATFKSSNDGIASVDADGKVIAKSKGTATITVTANGKDAICKVSVKEIPKGATTETKKDNNGNTVTVVKPSTPSGGSSGGTTTQRGPKTSREAFNLINAERAKLGLAPAVWDGECERIALLRAKELLTDCSHNGFVKFQNENRKLCECIAWGYSNANSVVDGWMNSKGHRNILMDEDYVKLAVARQGDYWVAVNSR